MKALNGVDGVHMHLENKKISKNFFWMLWILYAVVFMTKSCYSAAMASILSEGILTKSQTGLINAVFYGVYAPLQILGGICSDKYNPEKMIKIGLIGAGISNLIIFLNQNYYVMLIAWTFNAVIQFALWPAVFKIVSSQLEPGYRTKGVYYMSFSSTFGLILSYFVAAFVSKWQYNFIISAIALFGFAIAFHVADNYVERFMVPDSTPRVKTFGVDERKKDVSTWKLFWGSGFLCLVVVTALRTVVSNSVKTLSSTLLMESYESISPSIGNLLNILIIIAGVLGTFIVNQFIYPRLIRHVVVASVVLGSVALIPVTVMIFVGQIPLALFMVALCIASLLLNGEGIIMSRCNASFARYGKSGVAAGVNNSASAVAFMIQNYVIVAIADRAGWKSVMYVWIILLVVAAMFLIIAIPLWTKFKRRK